MVKIVDHSERRAAITKASISVISELGLEQAGLRNIAAEAGLTTGAVAHYFSDKDAVLEAALKEVGSKLFSYKQGDGNLPSLNDILPINPESKKYWKVWLAFCGHAGYSKKLQKIYKTFYLEIENSIAKQLNIKDKKRAQEIAASIIAAVDGVGLCATVQPDLWPAERQKARLTELLKPFFEQRN